jgi:hypothetical protein
MWIFEQKQAKDLERHLASGEVKTVVSKDSDLADFGLYLAGLPKSSSPSPVMRRSYLHAQSLSKEVQDSVGFFGWSKLLLAGSLASVVMFVGLSVYANYSSPGEALYPLKLVTERVRLTLPTTETNSAELKLKYTERRLSETTSVLADPNASSEARAGVLIALASQTQEAINSISNTPAKNNPKLLGQLSKVTEHQVEVLNSQSKNVTDKPETASAIEVAKEGAKMANLQILMIAAASDQVLADLGITTETVMGKVISFKGGYLAISGLDMEIFVSPTTKIIREQDTLELAAGQEVKAIVDFNSSKTSALAKSVEILIPITKISNVKPTNVTGPVNSTSPVTPLAPNLTPTPETDRVTSGFQIEDPVLPKSISE